MTDHTLLVVGTGEVSTALDSIATTLGWKAFVVDTLSDTEARLPDCDSVVVLSHHGDVDGPALAAAVRREAAYVGAMGSRRTQARRREWMLANDVPEHLLDSIRGPAGLDIGADTPAEIALSIMAEVVATHRGVSGGSLQDKSGPIHPGLAPGTADCPAG